ncbi:hypothetical protein OF83DRAFT_1177679, partial [Amylostereum chailletii]
MRFSLSHLIDRLNGSHDPPYPQYIDIFDNPVTQSLRFQLKIHKDLVVELEKEIDAHKKYEEKLIKRINRTETRRRVQREETPAGDIDLRDDSDQRSELDQPVRDIEHGGSGLLEELHLLSPNLPSPPIAGSSVLSPVISTESLSTKDHEQLSDIDGVPELGYHEDACDNAVDSGRRVVAEENEILLKNIDRGKGKTTHVTTPEESLAVHEQEAGAVGGGMSVSLDEVVARFASQLRTVAHNTISHEQTINVLRTRLEASEASEERLKETIRRHDENTVTNNDEHKLQIENLRNELDGYRESVNALQVELELTTTLSQDLERYKEEIAALKSDHKQQVSDIRSEFEVVVRDRDSHNDTIKSIYSELATLEALKVLPTLGLPQHNEGIVFQ